jgi:hypothetical protein
MNIVLFTRDDFSFSEMPLFYKSRTPKSLAKKVDPLFRFLGQYKPSLFAGTFIFIARKVR